MPLYVLLASNDDEFNNELLAQSQQYPWIEWVLPESPHAVKAHMAACWYPQADLLDRFPNIKCLHSLAAGVDHLGETLLNSTRSICRIVDEEQKAGMLEYVLWAVLYFQRDFDKAMRHQNQQDWQRYVQRPAQQTYVSIMGMGEIGSFVAKGLAQQGYQVAGWSNSRKSVTNVTSYVGKSELSLMLKKTDILINLLPLNDKTSGIINQTLLSELNKDAALVNCGRGGHVNYDDLITALQTQCLRGAILDVFDEEPLSKESPFWRIPNLLITPHMASASSIATLVKQVSENAMRWQSGDPLINRL
ncbi:glyoxylate/hydroxypyruvate reductase A [Marinomonas sp. THO17]|uniref:2-hydroxyacid dehydrogenase n=1 Tax=Marinomonas sp. THO17 TaxID=3149048 RepID=UPI00336C178E